MDDETAIDYVTAALAYLAYDQPSVRSSQSYDQLTEALNTRFKTDLPVGAISAAVTVLNGQGLLYTIDSRFVDPLINFVPDYQKVVTVWRYNGESWAATVLDRYMNGPEGWLGDAMRSRRFLEELDVQLTPIDDDVSSPDSKALPRVSLPASNQKALIDGIDQAIEKLPSTGASNANVAQAGALLSAARSLADAPEPPADLIWDLLNRTSQIAGIASLVVALIALFVSH